MIKIQKEVIVEESTTDTEKDIKFFELSLRADKGSRGIVIKRDGMRCLKCRSKGVQIHEIVPRSHFGKQSLHICFHPKNRCLLCIGCHEKAHTNKWRTDLLKIMKAKYGYIYEESQFRKYLSEESDEKEC